MIIELNKQIDNYDIDFIFPYIEKALTYAQKKVIAENYNKLELENILPENITVEDFDFYLNVSFVDEETIRTLNRENRNIDSVTDVLSFPTLDMELGKFSDLAEYDFTPTFDYEETDFDEELDEPSQDKDYILNLGDVIICVERAIEQAEEYGHSLTREMTFLALHGLLHVMGYDHEESRSTEELMFRLQDEILNEVNITRDIRDEKKIELQSNCSPSNELISELESHVNEVETEEAFNPNFKTGYIAILGRPNAGKSTLLNNLSGNVLAITSPKAKTTRHNIKTVLDDGESQMIFIDTPGIQRANNKLERYMASSAWGALEIADVVLLLVDPRRGGITEVEQTACKKAEELGLPLILVLSKTDIANKEKMLPLIKEYTDRFNFVDVVPISSNKNDNIDVLLEVIKEHLPVQDRIYTEDAYTDQSEKALAAEYIREEILHLLYQEVPHDVAVNIDKFTEKNNYEGERSLVIVEATILVNKASQKGVILGKSGRMLKRIGSNVRKKLEDLYEAKVYLELFVRVQKNWKNADNVLRDLGYTEGGNGPAEVDIIQ
ncbi:GTPase Era [Fastidiosipila sanguinis]|nr:GTPase Era [Fastidiosipila sanguinis]